MRVLIKVNRKWFFDRGRQFLLQGTDKLRYPTRSIVIMTIGNKNVVFKIR